MAAVPVSVKSAEPRSRPHGNHRRRSIRRAGFARRRISGCRRAGPRHLPRVDRQRRPAFRPKKRHCVHAERRLGPRALQDAVGQPIVIAGLVATAIAVPVALANSHHRPVREHGVERARPLHFTRHATRHSRGPYWKLLVGGQRDIFLVRRRGRPFQEIGKPSALDGCCSLRIASHSICRIRSRVTEKILPTSDSV